MKRLFSLLILLAVIVGAWFFITPWWTMKQIADAAEAGDGAALERVVDFPALREKLQADLAASREDGDDDLLDQIGDAVVTTAGGLVIETFATPNGLAVLMDASHVAPGEDYSWDVERDSLNTFHAVATTTTSGKPGPVLLFERRGFGWQLVGARLGG